MKTCLYVLPSQLKFSEDSHKSILDVLDHVSEGTDTLDLATVLYLLPGKNKTRGTAHVRLWMTPDQFIAKRGFWTCGMPFGAPDDLPGRFKLIRLRLDANPDQYPRKERDIYDWEFFYPAFRDHLATLFAHELHHYRRHHLGLHLREGEQAANRWALNHIQKLGYRAEGEKKKTPRGKRSFQTSILRQFPSLDPFARFRSLQEGNPVIIRRDPTGRYVDQPAIVVRPIRSHSKRIVIRTNDGKHWRWPMSWLEIPQNETS